MSTLDQSEAMIEKQEQGRLMSINDVLTFTADNYNP